MIDSIVTTPCKGVIDRLYTAPLNHGRGGGNDQSNVFRLVPYDETRRLSLVANHCDVHHPDS